MSQKKIDSYFESEEFPWLSRAVGKLRKRLDSVSVKRIDHDFVSVRHITTTKREVLSLDESSDEATDLIDCVTTDDIRLLDAEGKEVDRVNQRLYYKAPVTWWKPWTWCKYSEKPYFCTQHPVWLFDDLQKAKSIREWLKIRLLPPIHFILHFTPSRDNAKKLSLVIRKVPKSSKESREQMSLQMYIAFLIIQEDREKRLHLESLVAEVANEVAAVDAEPNSN